MAIALLSACDEESSPVDAKNQSTDAADEMGNGSTNSGKSEKKKEAIEYGTLTDARDGQTYKTVKIGYQWWMAENLNYAYLQPTSKLDSSSFCLRDSLEYCEKNGRLYLWSAAMDSAGLFSSDCLGCGNYGEFQRGLYARGVCPEGWHVPLYEEMQTLIDYVGGEKTAGQALQALQTNENGQAGAGTDDYGFSVLDVGTYTPEESKSYKNYSAFWLARRSKNLPGDAEALTFTFGKKESEYRIGSMAFAFSVRCAKDTNPTEAEIRRMTGAKTTTLVDPRDGKVYRTVTLGKYEWMAENLNYEMEESYCYNGADSNCTKYGRLYTYHAAGMACPKDWALPNVENWNGIIGATTGAIHTSTSGWVISGLDYYGLSILPAGYYYSKDGSYESLGRSAYFWASSSGETFHYSFHVDEKSVLNEETGRRDFIPIGFSASKISTSDTTSGYSVRCIKWVSN